MLNKLFKKNIRHDGCNHSFCDKGSTLEKLDKINLSYPPKFMYQCTKCGKIFNNVSREEDLKFMKRK